MDDTAPAIMPNMTCPECADAMWLVGIERDTKNPKVHFVTFECPAGHIAVMTVPS